MVKLSDIRWRPSPLHHPDYPVYVSQWFIDSAGNTIQVHHVYWAGTLGWVYRIPAPDPGPNSGFITVDPFELACEMATWELRWPDKMRRFFRQLWVRVRS